MQLATALERTLAALAPPTPFALAVSGGPDSTALMHLAASLKPIVFTVDHGLRAESAGEAAGVAAAAGALGLKHETLAWTGEKAASGLQAAARAARYRLLAAACARVRAASLMTGHTLDDQIETVAMRRGKGSGAFGLAGMPMQTRLPGGAVRLVRPLLWTRKAALTAYLDGIGAAYITDPSNSDVRFDRGRLRAAGVDDVPAAEIAAAMAARVRGERRALAFLGAAAQGDGMPALDRAAFRAEEADIQDIILTALLRLVGGSPYPGTRAERGRVSAALAAEGPFAARTLAGCVLRAAGGAVRIRPEFGGATAGADWWLPFGQYRQLGPDGQALT